AEAFLPGRFSLGRLGFGFLGALEQPPSIKINVAYIAFLVLDVAAQVRQLPLQLVVFGQRRLDGRHFEGRHFRPVFAGLRNLGANFLDAHLLPPCSYLSLRRLSAARSERSTIAARPRRSSSSRRRFCSSASCFSRLKYSIN